MVRFYFLLALLLVASGAGFAALVLSSASYAEVAAFGSVYGWQPQAFTATTYQGLRAGLGGAALLALAAGWALGLPRTLAGLGAALAGVGQRLRASWWALPRRQRRLAAGLLVALTLLRLYYSLVLQAFDDGTSYEMFVSQRLLVVSAGYPIPNNHVLSNLLDWLFYQLHPGFWWSMRLPVLLTSTGATGLWFLALLRRSSFRVALLAVGWFCMALDSLHLAAIGRGYWLLIGLGAVGFFSLLRLLPGPGLAPGGPARRLAALGLVLSSVLGLYTVPTHFLLVGPLYGWWGLQGLRRRSWPVLTEVAASGALTLLGAGLLYTPLLLISGPERLFFHRFMAPLPGPVFWRWTADILTLRYQLLTLPLAAVGLLALLVLVRRARAGHLPAALARPLLQLGPLSAWLVLVPYLMAVAQRSIPPERTLVYKAIYLFIGLALVADWALRWAQRPAWVRAGLLAGSLVFALGQLGRLQAQERMWQVAFSRESARPSAEWLSRQVPGPVLAIGSSPRFLLHYYGPADFRRPPWRLDAVAQPGVRYRYLVLAPDEDLVYQGRALAGPAAARCQPFAIFIVAK
ncbi:MAG: hypothetical protein ACRYFX_25475 [Janthinobacterium lividum]